MGAKCIVNFGDMRTYIEWEFHRAGEDACGGNIADSVIQWVLETGAGLSPMEPEQLEAALFPNPASDHVRRAVENGEELYFFLIGGPEHEVMLYARRVRDWITGLKDRDPRLFRKLPKMRFPHMLAHADRWHKQLRRKAKRRPQEGIVRDDEGAPTAFELDGEWEGWRWVWLRSDEARYAEGEYMGNCVGCGFYDDFDAEDGCGVFSLRDPQNRPHVTLELDATEVAQAEARGGNEVPDRYKRLVEQAAGVIGLRLLLTDPTTPPKDGHRTVNDSDYWIKGGVLHREDGPAIIRRCSDGYGVPEAEWWIDGKFLRRISCQCPGEPSRHEVMHGGVEVDRARHRVHFVDVDLKR